jgi:hypothetical protein
VDVDEQVEREAPARARRAAPLTRAEKRAVALAALAPIVLAAVVLTPVAVATGLTAGDVTVAVLVYGGLLGLAAAFVTTDRLQARQCPRCARRHGRDRRVCDDCGYDLATGARYACSERHLVYLDDGGDGRCECGRWLEPLPVVRGVGPQVVAMLRIGGWLLAFLLAVGLVLRWLEGRL